MDHRAVYDRLIRRALARPRPAVYVERHHILPKCLGGGNGAANLVYLTGREHYVVHQLLALMHPDMPGLTYAAVKMARQSTGSRAYEWLRVRHSRNQTAMRLGKALSAAQVKAMSDAHKGVPWSESRRAIGNASARGRTVRPDVAQRIAATLMGVKHTEVRRQRMSEAAKGRIWTPAQHAARALGTKARRAAKLALQPVN